LIYAWAHIKPDEAWDPALLENLEMRANSVRALEGETETLDILALDR
jgi:hypothetical protein